LGLWSRTNLSKMFLFRGYIEVKVSPMLKNLSFFHGDATFGPLSNAMFMLIHNIP